MSWNRITFHPKASEAALSLSLILVASFALLLIHDTVNAPAWYGPPSSGYGPRSLYPADSLLQLVFAGLFALPLLVWHACEMASKSAPSSRVARIITSYKLMLIVLSTALVSLALATSGVFEKMECWEVETTSTSSGMVFSSCKSIPTFGLEYLWGYCFLGLLVLALVKVIFSVAEKLGVEM